MAQKLKNKVAVVTGASKGIGAGIAKALAAEGASVVVNYNTDRAGAEAVVSAISASGGKAIAVEGDVSTKAHSDSVVDAAINSFGKLDVLVNNAGIAEFLPAADFTVETARRAFDTNVFGPLQMTRAALRHFGEGASIINIGSIVSRLAPPDASIYAGTKGALDVITSVLANELGPRKIRVNTISPGMTATERAIAGGLAESDFGKTMIGRTPLGRIGTVPEVASVAVFLASDDAAWVNGEHIFVTGGAS